MYFVIIPVYLSYLCVAQTNDKAYTRTYAHTQIHTYEAPQKAGIPGRQSHPTVFCGTQLLTHILYTCLSDRSPHTYMHIRVHMYTHCTATVLISQTLNCIVYNISIAISVSIWSRLTFGPWSRACVGSIYRCPILKWIAETWARYVKLWVAYVSGMSWTFSLSLRVSDLDMHHGTCVTHVPWCMTGSLTSCFLWSRWQGKRSRHSQRMRNPQFFVSGRRPMTTWEGTRMISPATTAERHAYWFDVAEIIIVMSSAYERQRYVVTLSLIGLTHVQNDSCIGNLPSSISEHLPGGVVASM